MSDTRVTASNSPQGINSAEGDSANIGTTTSFTMLRRLAPAMFWLSLSFLALLAATIVVWIDVPRVAETVASGAEIPDKRIALDSQHVNEQREYEEVAYARGWWYVICMLVIWPIFWMEQLLRRFIIFRSSATTVPGIRHSNWWCAVIPPLRLCAREPLQANQVWLPWLGWQCVDEKLQSRLERDFSIPMVGIALLILPVLVLQVFFKDQVATYAWLRFAMHFSTGLIWFAFATEFIVMVSVARNRVRYCQRHWLDLVIILLPLISFLRTFKLLRMTKVAKIFKLPQVARFIRVYRLRGVAMRGMRALMILGIVHRVLRISPQRQLENLRVKVAEKERELETMRAQIKALEQTIQDDASTEGDARTVP